MIRFYALVLERGRNSPLDLVVVKGGSNCRSVFRLLATHSERWKTADIQCDMSDLRYFAAAQGKLPSLETLVLYSWDDGPEVDLFQVAPKQKSVTMTSPILLKIITKFPLHRLHTFAYVGLIPAEAEIAIPP